MSTLVSEQDLTLRVINELDEIVDAMDMCSDLGVPDSELESLDEFKERLRLHYEKINGMSKRNKIEQSILKAGKDDEKKRKILTEMMESMIDIIHRTGTNNLEKRNSEFFEDLLRREGTTNNLKRDCAGRKASIERGECVILVAGETSAGKSSVLNLLFEQNILPVHTKSSTSVITIVRYGKRARATVVYKSDKPEMSFPLDESGLKTLHSIAFMESASERECHDVREVQVYLPLKLLQSGLVLVDSPGIGENEFLENELIDFISRTQVMGFMYIIKTDNAGGVQEDRLLHLLKIVVNKQRTNSKSSQFTGTSRFDPKAALFVCNRVDLVEASEQERVRQNAIDKLSACWPCFDESQIVFFSTDKCRRDVDADPDYINDSYKELLDGIRDLFVTALDRRIRMSYKWIENVLKRSVHHLKSMVKRLDLSDKELRDKSAIAKNKLGALKHKADTVVERLYETLEKRSESLCQDLKDFIGSKKCQNSLLQGWDASELPSVDQGLGNWPWIKSKIHAVFYDKLSKLVEEWDREEEKIDSIEKELSGDTKFDLNLLEHELAQIEKEIQDDSSSSSSDDLSKLSKMRRKSRASSLIPLTPNRSRFLITEPKLPLRLAGHLISPFVNVLEGLKNKSRVDDYKKAPVRVAEEKAKDIYNALLSQCDINDKHGGLYPFVEYLLERPREYIGALERKIPSLILSNQLLVNHFEQSIVAERAHQKDYCEMMTDIENLRRSLTEYGEGYIFVEDFMKGEIQVQQISPDGGNVSVAFKVSDFLSQSSGQNDIVRKRDIRGLWTITYSGILLRNGLERPIGIKVYLPSSGMKNTFHEVAKLRCLTYRDMNLAEFLGIHHAEAPTPAFVYDGDLRSVRRFLQSPFLIKRNVVPEVLEDTAAALDYLHNKGLVHMELTQDTVTVNEDGLVKLTGACLPRVAMLPMDTEMIQTGDFVYLPPEVLRGETYTASADIYSFALFILELVQVNVGTVFKRERIMTLCDFIRKVDPEEMLDLEEVVKVFTVKTRALIQNCLKIEKDFRPDAGQVLEYTMFIKDEEEALSKIPSRTSRGRVIKRNSDERYSINSHSIRL